MIPSFVFFCLLQKDPLYFSDVKNYFMQYSFNVNIQTGTNIYVHINKDVNFSNKNSINVFDIQN